MARIKPLVWIVSLLIGQLALAANQSESAPDSPDPALQVTPHLGPPPKPSKKNARTRQRPAPAKAPRDKRGPASPAAELTSPPALPPSAAQVFVIQHFSPERVDPDLAQPMVAKMSAPAPKRAAASTVVIVPLEPAADIPMDAFVAWARETPVAGGRPDPRPVSAVKSQGLTGASLFASVTSWLREATPSAPPVEPIVMVSAEPAPDISMDMFVAWAKETTVPGGRPDPRPLSVVKSQEPLGASLFASVTSWLREATPSAPLVEPIVMVPVEPAPDISMDMFVAWAEATTIPGGRPDSRPVSVVKSQEPLGASLFASVTGWLRETTPSAPLVEPIVMVPVEPAPDLPMEVFTAWASQSMQPAASEQLEGVVLMVSVDPAPDLPMELFTAWAGEAALPDAIVQPEETMVMVAVAPAPDLPMEVFTAWAVESTLAAASEQPEEPIVMVAVDPALDLPMELFTAWAVESTLAAASEQPEEPVVMVAVDPAPDLPMEVFTAWASDAQGAHQADVVIELEAFDVTPDLPMASFADWAKEPTGSTIEEASNASADQAPAMIAPPATESRGFEPAPDLPMEVFTEWAKQPESPVVAPSESSRLTATPDTAATLNVQTEIETSEAAPDLPMESFIEWAQANKPAAAPALQTAQ